jgi:serine/threonine protein kinase
MPYSVQKELSCSGQRTVYIAEEITTGRQVVIKVCNYVQSRVARIQREIKILQSMDSDLFPKVERQSYITKEIIRYFIDSFDIHTEQDLIRRFESEDIRPFFVTVEEYVEHMPWAEAKNSLRHEVVLVDFMETAFRALGMLWEKKIVHRDIKPDNLLVRLNMKPVLIDLGIAKSFSEGTADLTGIGFRSPLTPRYASPEQLQDNKAEVNYKSDQFSFGVVLYELLTDELPYGDIHEIGHEEIARRMLTDDRIRLTARQTSLSRQLAELIDRLLEGYPYKRYRNVDAILAELAVIRSSI